MSHKTIWSFQDPLYAAFWERVQNNRNETVYKGIKHGLSLIEGGQNVIQATYGRIVGYFKANPFVSQKVKVFGKSKAKYFGSLLPANSPLKPILQKGTDTLIEAGALDHLIKAWVGRGVPINQDSEKMVLSTGQVFFVFGIMLITIGTSTCILLGEVIKKKMANGMEDQTFLVKRINM